MVNPFRGFFVDLDTQAPSSFYKTPTHMSANMCALVFPYPCCRSGHKGMAYTGTTNMMMPCMFMYLSVSFGHQIVAGHSNWTIRLVSTAAAPLLFDCTQTTPPPKQERGAGGVCTHACTHTRMLARTHTTKSKVPSLSVQSFVCMAGRIASVPAHQWT